MKFGGDPRQQWGPTICGETVLTSWLTRGLEQHCELNTRSPVKGSKGKGAEVRVIRAESTSHRVELIDSPSDRVITQLEKVELQQSTAARFS